MTDPIDAIWPEIRKAFAFYGKRLVSQYPRGARRKQIQDRLDEGFEPEELVRAVHGYVQRHQGLDRDFGDGNRSGDFFRPETIFKAQGFEDRVECGDRPWYAPASSKPCRCTLGIRPTKDRDTGCCSGCGGALTDYQKSHCDFIDRPLRVVGG